MLININLINQESLLKFGLPQKTLFVFSYPDENANAVSRVSGEFKVFKSLPTNLDFGFIAL